MLIDDATIRFRPAGSPRGGIVAIAASLMVFAVLAVGAAVGPQALPSRNASVFHLLTGLPDPTCGLTHSLFAIGHGDWAAAADYNPLGFLAVFVAVALLPLGTQALAHGRSIRLPPKVVPVALALILGVWSEQLVRALA